MDSCRYHHGVCGQAVAIPGAGGARLPPVGGKVENEGVVVLAEQDLAGAGAAAAEPARVM